MDVELTEVRDFLATIAPFDQLPQRVLNELPPKLTMRYYRRGTTVFALGQEVSELLVIRSGATDTLDERGELVLRNDEGSTNGYTALVAGKPNEYSIVAVEDTLVLAMPKAVFFELFETQPVFKGHFLTRNNSIRSASAALQASESGNPILQTRVRDMIGKEPITASADLTVQQAASVMTEHRVSALLITEGTEPIGIITDRDLRRRVLAAGLDYQTPVREVMTTGVITVTPEMAAFEVMLEMVSRNLHHLPVVSEGRPVGMVTSGDLMRLERANPVYLVGEISHQRDLAGLVEISKRRQDLVVQLVHQDASADDIHRLMTAVGDELARALLRLGEAEFGPAPVPYAWLVLGSQARHEHGLASDQDHALLLSNDAQPEHDAYFAQLADFVSKGLEACGYPLCPGDVMASNPKWRMTLAQWKRQFHQWTGEPDSESILHAQIFFDLRCGYGDQALVDELKASFLHGTSDNARFLGHLAKMASDREPPLGFFRGFLLEREGEHKDTFDLKARGIAAIVEIARVFALSKGLPQVGTVERIAAAETAGALGRDSAAQLQDAFEFISYVRLRHQARQIRAGDIPDNHVRPGDLSNLERRHLKESFAVIRQLQEGLAYTYRTSFIS